MVQRSQKHPFLSLFDGADPNVSTASRFITTTPTQALYLMNSPFVKEQSLHFARRLTQRQESDRDRVRFAVESSWCLEPTSEEITDFLAFMTQYRHQTNEPGVSENQRSEVEWAALTRVLMTSNPFLFVD